MKTKTNYTVHGKRINEVIDNHMGVINENVFRIVGRKKLEAVILCGSYGRGEGGVYFSPEGNEELFNNYDLVVIIKSGNRKERKRISELLKEFGTQYADEIGIEVDFGTVKTLRQIKRSRFTLFNYELKYGHIVIYGNKDILKSMPDYNIKEIDPKEAVYLLLNRGVGLVMSQRKINFGDLSKSDNEFVTRNIFKAIMAIGDAALICDGCYDLSYLRRLDIVKSKKVSQISPLIEEFDIYNQYINALEYKISPKRDIFGNDELEKMLKTIEKKIIKAYYAVIARAFGNSDLADYRVFENGLLEKCCPITLAKNAYLNIETFGLKAVKYGWICKHPRYRLLYSLPYFLDSEVASGFVPVCHAICAPVDCADKSRDFISLWEKFC